MSYDELMESILTAQEQMLQHGIEANSVTLNGRRYGKLIENLPPNMKPTVFGMAVKADYALPDDYHFVVQYEPPQPKTNADRIKSMTAEELANFLVQTMTCTACQDLHGGKCPNQQGKEIKCGDVILNWLKQEVEDGIQ